ncbi:hypothetical protein EYF80_020714 [Liparis tanakae]|uniref:Uncharacterized protein n=1 Tax=Liparis tanakae TaxID=230148 RepID=A0A4Z2HTY1_9TELE|nr:hypothetical protein EYF80_020714 [Liparis tanakae]
MGLTQVEAMAVRWQNEKMKSWPQDGMASWFQSNTVLKTLSGSQESANATTMANSMALILAAPLFFFWVVFRPRSTMSFLLLRRSSIQKRWSLIGKGTVRFWKGKASTLYERKGTEIRQATTQVTTTASRVDNELVALHGDEDEGEDGDGD